MISLLGVPIHDPDVVFTDLGLAILAAYLGRQLWTVPGRGTLPTAGVVLLCGLASAALWGAIFHAFFPAKTATFAGFVVWIPVALSILVTAATMLELALCILLPRLAPRVRRPIVAVYAVGALAVVLLVDESFTSIVRFYVPALILFLVAAGQQVLRSRSAGWMLIVTGLTTSVGAALLQQAEVSIHPTYFDHNAVYHVVQGIALVVLYLGFRRIPEALTKIYAIGTDSANR